MTKGLEDGGQVDSCHLCRPQTAEQAEEKAVDGGWLNGNEVEEFEGEEE